MLNLIQDKTFLITGGAGFIGSHLCDEILKNNGKVICVDNLYTGTLDNIRQHLDNPNFIFHCHDICEEFDAKADFIFNLACPASPIHYQKDPIVTIKTNVMGSFNVLEIAKKNGARILQASTSEIYGDPQIHPQVESYWGNTNPIGVRACYDEGKRCAETIFVDYMRKYGLDIRIARIFNTYGSRMSKNDGRVVSNFITQALNEDKITIYGTGAQTRSFCYVSDLINGLISLMLYNQKKFYPINLGNPNELTIAELAQIISTLCNSNVKIINQKLPEDDPAQRQPNIDLAKNLLRWEPIIDLKSGLERTISYFKSI